MFPLDLIKWDFSDKTQRGRRSIFLVCLAVKSVFVGRAKMDEVVLILLDFLSRSLLEMCKGSVKTGLNPKTELYRADFKIKSLLKVKRRKKSEPGRQER